MCSERSASPRQRPRRIRKIPVVIMALALALGVATAILSFVDVGGAAILKMARETLKERTGMGLSAAGIKDLNLIKYSTNPYNINSMTKIGRAHV